MKEPTFYCMFKDIELSGVETISGNAVQRFFEKGEIVLADDVGENTVNLVVGSEIYPQFADEMNNIGTKLVPIKAAVGIEGGEVTSLLSDMPIDLVIVDFDEFVTSRDEGTKSILVDGEKVRISRMASDCSLESQEVVESYFKRHLQNESH